MERFIEMKGLAKTLHDLGGELGIERIHLARLAGCQVHNKKGDYGDEKESDDFLDDASADERKHKKCLKCLKCAKVPKVEKPKNPTRKHEMTKARKRRVPKVENL